jgi:hypothetical protein
VTKSNVHAILGELHKLLATYRAADFIEASNYGGISRPMKAALRTLAHEAEPDARDVSRHRVISTTVASNSRNRETSAPSERVRVLSLIRRSKIFESTRSLITYGNSLGLRLMAKPKDGRDRLASKLASLIEILPDHRKSEVISDLLAGRNNQTQGWIDVIKSGKQ